MNNLESRIEKLESRLPTEDRTWVRQLFSPREYGGSVEMMEAAIKDAREQAASRGENLMVREIVPCCKLPRSDG